MQEVRVRRYQVAILGVCLACMPVELAVSGAILMAIAFVDHMFDPNRMLRGELEPAQE